jgi:hypothetical protein
MNTTTMSITTTLLTAAVCVLAVLLAGASLCRVNALSPTSHKFGWRIMYVVYGGSAISVLGYVLTNPCTDELLALLLAALAGPALNVAITHRQWRDGLVPPIANKPPTGAAP